MKDVHLKDQKLAPDKTLFECHICKRPFSKKNQLEDHVKIHKKKELFTCKICGFAYGRILDLNRHLNKVHPNQNGQKKEYLKCEFCPRDFLCGSALQTHNRIHQKENIATCEFCGFAYGTIHDLNRHINKVHPEKKSQLKKNNLKCEFCLRDFLRGSELQRHIQIHQKENIATCEFCGFAYGTIHDLNRHINKVHPEKKMLSLQNY